MILGSGVPWRLGLNDNAAGPNFQIIEERIAFTVIVM